MNIDLFTDGSCSAKDRVGGWAFYVPGHLYDGAGAELDTTISRMELMAAIQGLIEIGIKHGPSDVIVHSDSEYVVKGASDKSRKRNLNNDLWDLLDDCETAHSCVTYKHVRGHAGNDGNELVDKLAREARNQLLRDKK